MSEQALTLPQRDPVKPVCAKVTEATLTYVAVGEDRRPRVVPPVD